MKLFVFLSIMLLGGTSFGNEVSSGRGESTNCELSRSLAIKNAIEKFSEREIEVSQRQTCKESKGQIDCSFIKDLQTKAGGTLKKVIEENHIIKDNSCIVNVRVEIERAKVFATDVKAKDFYYAGEPLVFDLVTKEPLYVYIFNVYSFDDVNVLFQTSEPLNGKLVLPQNKQIVTYLHGLQNVSDEYLIFLFTKHKLTFKKDLSKKEVESIIDSVPLYSRKVVFHNFKIIRRTK